MTIYMLRSPVGVMYKYGYFVKREEAERMARIVSYREGITRPDVVEVYESNAAKSVEIYNHSHNK